MSDGTGLAVTTLGMVSVLHKGRPCPDLGTRKALALLVYLVWSHQAVSREALAAFFWEEVPDANARASLNVALSQLRKQLPEYIDATRDVVGLDRRHDVWLDAEVFARRWQAWRKSYGDAPYVEGEALRALENTVALYQGHFMDGLLVDAGAAFEEWVRFERERLQQFVGDGLEALVRAYLHGGADERGIEAARRLLLLDPLRESGHELMMTLLLRHGQRSAAVAHYEAYRRLLAQELAVSPGAEIQKLYQRVTTAPVACPLPARPAFTAGREQELSRLHARLIRPDCRLLTITGSWGTGKTHLALEAAWGLRHRFLNGICFVPLAGQQSASEMTLALAAALGLEVTHAEKASEQLGCFLRDKEILLLLDGFEYAPGAGRMLEHLLAQAPHLTLLVTSRERLGLLEEWIERLEGLTYPQLPLLEASSLEALALQYGAIELFLMQAKKLGVSIAGEDQDRAAIARIVRFVDGLPLAIQLAASWLPVMSCEELADELLQNGELLASPRRSRWQQQQMLGKLLSRYLDCLTQSERQVYLKLSVFPESFDRDAAANIAGASLVQLRTLFDKSVLRAAPQGLAPLRPATAGAEQPRPQRFLLPRLLQQYAREQLRSFPEQETLALERHAAYFADFLRQRRAALQEKGYRVALREIDAEKDNVRQAWEFAVTERRFDLLSAGLDSLAAYYYRLGNHEAGRVVLMSAAARLQLAEGEERLLGRLLAWQALFSILLGRSERGARLWAQSLFLLKASAEDTRREQAFVYLQKSRLAMPEDFEEAQRLCEIAIGLYEQLEEERKVALALRQLAAIKEQKVGSQVGLQAYAVVLGTGD